MRTATCDVCTAYIADVLPVPGIAPDGTAKVDRIGDLRIVCDDCAKAYEVIVRERSSKGVQPPDGTTERDAALWRAFCQLLQDPEADVSMDHGGWLLLKGSLENAVDAEARANVAEPSMSPPSPPENSGTDGLDSEVRREAAAYARRREGVAKP